MNSLTDHTHIENELKNFGDKKQNLNTSNTFSNKMSMIQPNRCQPKNRGMKHPLFLDGENNGSKPHEHTDDFGG